MDTKRHEDTWTSFNDKRHQNASAILCPWCDFVSLVDHPLNWFQVSPAPAPHDGADHSRVKQPTFMAYGDQGLCFVNLVVCIGNIDRQDKQDKKRLRAMLTGSMIGCAFEVIHELGSGFLESLLKKRRWSNARG